MDLHDSSAAEQAIMAVLAGTPITDAAVRVRTSPERLAEAIEIYCTAGRAALDGRPEPVDWHQVNIEYINYPTAEHAFISHLLPHLRRETQSGAIATWWFVRKHPCWRLRIAPGPNSTAETALKHLANPLNRMCSASVVRRWWLALYEPETAAFGGPEGMKIAHDLFHTDSIGVLDYLHGMATHHREPLDAKATSLLLVSLFLRAAGQEWSEQGDVWARVAEKRPLPDEIPIERVSAMTPKLQKLLAVSPTPALAADGSFAPLARWMNGLQHSGRALADVGHEGRLSLGTRAILARHILFHWNRMGFTVQQQAIWARAARQTILGA
ncbi:thiopeptide-type bacteriocin biosynthesis protein [Streptomyces sp. NBRC 110028]|uniref:thiopeptide-type bacteriocin biosynthesis protein n=1 Tax=Streptomyces sp. NBRC 110028 TaxID=1621260 RepID=UPI00099EFA3E|nr:thiopeptide-type bacteriocin biosynthesis protein [Streptomyces sp. NBRC 110028]